MKEKKFTWHKVADDPSAIMWQSNKMAIAEVAGKKITLALLEGKVVAFAYKCPHASGIMADGFIDAHENIACPLHRFRFNIRNGRNVSGEGYYLKTYPVEHRENGIFVGFEQSGWLSVFS